MKLKVLYNQSKNIYEHHAQFFARLEKFRIKFFIFKCLKAIKSVALLT